MITELGIKKHNELLQLYINWVKDLTSIDVRPSKLADNFKREETAELKLKANQKHSAIVEAYVKSLDNDIDKLRNDVKKIKYPLRNAVSKVNSFELENTNALLFVAHLPEHYTDVLRNALDLKRFDFYFLAVELMSGKQKANSDFGELNQFVLEALGLKDIEETLNELKGIAENAKSFINDLYQYEGTIYWQVFGSENLDALSKFNNEAYESLRLKKYPNQNI